MEKITLCSLILYKSIAKYASQNSNTGLSPSLCDALISVLTWINCTDFESSRLPQWLEYRDVKVKDSGSIPFVDFFHSINAKLLNLL